MGHIIGERIVLREYRMEDLSAIQSWVNDSVITSTLSDLFSYPQSIKKTEDFIHMMMDGKSDTHKSFVIAHQDTLEYIGQIDVLNISWKNRTASLAIVIGSKKDQGRGFGSEAIRLLQYLVFNEMNLNRLELQVYDFNHAAIRCYKKCGFVEEGRARQKIYRNGKYNDIIHMSILKSEYDTLVQRTNLTAYARDLEG
ncbi:GNAT family N-acetyltransferase [Paenibacillus urinalis]|uniref:GNAT family N-acetyltransferase n=1 Tax=Paenibacillus urinalis TaxID=521520 RepID=UPI001961084C